jgi:hypothetical protein
VNDRLGVMNEGPAALQVPLCTIDIDGVHLAERAQLFLRPKLLHAKFARVKARNCWKFAAEMACLIG